MPRHAFISYSSKDLAIAVAICQTLEANGIQCWYAERNALSGDDWTVSIMDALAASTIMILVWSAKSNRSKHVIREVQHAFNKGIAVIPFCIEKVAPAKELEYCLAFVQKLDATTPPTEENLSHLVARVRSLAATEIEEPESSREQRQVRLGSVGIEGETSLEDTTIRQQLAHWPPPSVNFNGKLELIRRQGGLHRRPGCVISVSFTLALAITFAAAFLIVNHSSNSAWQDTPKNREADIAHGVAARVNGKQINLSEVDRELNKQTFLLQPSPAELKNIRVQVLEDLILREALVQRAERENLLPNDDQVASAIAQQKVRSGLTEEEFQLRLKEQGMTMEDLRTETRKDLAIKNLQDKWIGVISVSDEEIEDYYNKHKEENSRHVRVSVIVADPTDNHLADDVKSESQTIRKIQEIYAQLRRGADFGEVARARSEDSNRTNGGDIGSFSEDALITKGSPKALVHELFYSMSVGDITEPVRLPDGRWCIFKLTDRDPQRENLTLESPGVREQITNAIIAPRRQTAEANLKTSTMNETKAINYLKSGTNP